MVRGRRRGRRLRRLRLPLSVSTDAARARDAHGGAHRSADRRRRGDRGAGQAQGVARHVHRRREGQGGGRIQAQGERRRAHRGAAPQPREPARRDGGGAGPGRRREVRRHRRARRELPRRQDHRHGNGIDVSEAGVSALKILAETLKKASARARIVARASSSRRRPRELKNLFHLGGRAPRGAAPGRGCCRRSRTRASRRRPSRSSARPTSRRRVRAARRRRPPSTAWTSKSSLCDAVTTRRFGRAAGVGLGIGIAVCAITAPPVWAYDFSIDLRTIGQGYQVRGFAPGGGNELLTRRRLTQLLNLSVFDIEPSRWHGDDLDRAARNVVYVDASLRFESDFGGYMTGRPEGANEIRELQQGGQVDILYAYLAGAAAWRIGGRVPTSSSGGSSTFDVVDFYAFDGADVLVRLNALVAAEAFGGTEVLGELPLSSPMYELDGTSAGSRAPETRPGRRTRSSGRSRARRSSSAATARTRRRPCRRASPTGASGPRRPISSRASPTRASTTRRWRSRRARSSRGGSSSRRGCAKQPAPRDVRRPAGELLRVRTTARQYRLGLEMAYLAPQFDGDSIWNIFATGAYRDSARQLRAHAARGRQALVARGFARHFEAVLSRRADRRLALGGRRQRARPGGGGAAFSGSTATSTAASGGRKTWRRPVGALGGPAARLRSRGPPHGVRLAVGPAARRPDKGFVLGAQARRSLPPRRGEGVLLHLLVEDNVGTFYTGQYRGARHPRGERVDMRGARIITAAVLAVAAAARRRARGVGHGGAAGRGSCARRRHGDAGLLAARHGRRDAGRVARRGRRGRRAPRGGAAVSADLPGAADPAALRPRAPPQAGGAVRHLPRLPAP